MNDEHAAPPLLGRWHHGEGHLCSGSLRIARADFDTNPTNEFQTEVFEWITATLNAELRRAAAPKAEKPQEKQAYGWTEDHLARACSRAGLDYVNGFLKIKAYMPALAATQAEPVKPHGEPPDEQLQAAFERSSGGPNPYFRCKTCGMTEPGVRTCLAEHFKKCNAIAVPGTNQTTSGE